MFLNQQKHWLQKVTISKLAILVKNLNSKIQLINDFSADGDYQITTQTKATIHYDGRIIWEPPMIYKSYCAIDIEYYPFDIQSKYYLTYHKF